MMCSVAELGTSPSSGARLCRCTTVTSRASPWGSPFTMTVLPLRLRASTAFAKQACPLQAAAICYVDVLQCQLLEEADERQGCTNCCRRPLCASPARGSTRTSLQRSSRNTLAGSPCTLVSLHLPPYLWSQVKRGRPAYCCSKRLHTQVRHRDIHKQKRPERHCNSYCKVQQV